MTVNTDVSAVLTWKLETRPKDHHIDTLTSFACILNPLLAASFPGDPPVFQADRDLS